MPVPLKVERPRTSPSPGCWCCVSWAWPAGPPANATLRSPRRRSAVTTDGPGDLARPGAIRRVGRGAAARSRQLDEVSGSSRGDDPASFGGSGRLDHLVRANDEGALAAALDGAFEPLDDVHGVRPGRRDDE